MSGLFPPLSPTEYLFLEGGQPLNHKISVRHPHNNDVLFTLFAWDHKDGALHYGLLHTACAIIADNRHDGYLSASRTPNAERIALDHDDLVFCQPANYYFHVPDDPDYPVVPTFDDWRFPNSLPSAWLSVSTDDDNNAAQATTQSNFSAGVKMRDRTCRLSNHSSATETAHLCPEKEEAWYLRNDMQVWNSNQIPNHINMTRDVANCLLLCSNLHKPFDNRIWVFFPKGPDTLVAHFLQAAPYQAALHHNVTTRSVQCNPHFVFARFAWALISSLRAYFSKSTPRETKVWAALRGR